jgi:hypothetical protein
MVAILRPQPDTRSVVEPETSSLWLFWWNFQPLSSPQSLDPPVADRPASLSKEGRDAPIAIAAILAGQFDHAGDETLFIGTSMRATPLRGAVLAQNATDTTLRYLHSPTNMIDAGTATSGA